MSATTTQMLESLLKTAQDDWECLTLLVQLLDEAKPTLLNDGVIHLAPITAKEQDRLLRALQRTLYRHHIAQDSLSPPTPEQEPHEPLSPSAVDPRGGD